MNDNFKSDFYRMTGSHCRLNLKNIYYFLKQHNIRYMYYRRLCEKNNRNLIAKYKLFKYSRKYGIEIAPTAQIGKGLYLGHPYNITVGSDVVIGNNVNLHKGCTIGRENRGKRTGVPTIGNCVYVGINSTIVGNIKIGNNVMIAPNSFVNFDVPDNSIVIGNPAKMHPNDNAIDNYINFIV